MAVPIPQPIAPVATDQPNAQPNMQPPPPPEGATEFSVAPPPPPEGATEFKPQAQPQAQASKPNEADEKGPVAGVKRAAMSLIKLPGQIGHALVTDPENDEEKQFTDQLGKTGHPGLDALMGHVNLGAKRLLSDPMVESYKKGRHLEDLAEKETDPKKRAALKSMGGSYIIGAHVPLLGPLAAAMEERGEYGNMEKGFETAPDMFHGSPTADPWGALAEGVSYMVAPEALKEGKNLVKGGVRAGVDAVKGAIPQVRPTTTQVGSTSVPVRARGAVAETLQKAVPDKMQEFYSKQTSPAVAKGIGDITKEAGSTLGETTTKESDPMGMLSHADEKAGRAQAQFKKVDQWSKNKLSEYQTQADNARGDFTTEGRAQFNEAMDAQDSLFDVYKKKFPDEAADIDSAKKDWREQMAVRRVNKALARQTTSGNTEGVDYKFKQGKQLANTIHSLITDDRDLLGRAGFTDDHIEQLKQFGKIIEEEGNIPKVDRVTRILSQIALKSVGVGGGFAAGGPLGVGVGIAGEIAMEKGSRFMANRVLGKILTTPEALKDVTESVKGGNTPTMLEKMSNSQWFNTIKETAKNLHHDESGEMTIPGSHSGGADGFLRGRHMDWDSQNKSVVPDQPEDGVIEDDKEDDSGVANNASGESSVSQEALNRKASETSQGVKRVVVDTRSGAERPLIGADAVDYQAKPYESVEFRGGNRDGEVIDQGRSARPYTRKTAPNAAFSKGANDTDLFRQAKEKLGPNASLSEIAQEAQKMKDAGGSSVADDANAYAKKKGISLDHTKVGTDVRGHHIADAYEEMEHTPNDYKTRKSYEALKDEVKDQWKHLQERGYTMSVSDTDPYQSYPEMRDDIKNNKHIAVWSGGQPPADHPLAGVDPDTGVSHNTLFRAVHDIMGHAAGDNDFSEAGEENAYNLHRQAFSKDAVPALTTETKGQTGWFFNNKGVREGGQPGTFATQKAGLLPEQYHNSWDEKKVLDHIQSGKDFAILQAENPNNTRISDGENAKRNAKLVQDLRERGHEAIPVGGNTKDVEGNTEHAFFVPDISPSEAAELGRKHQQAAILTNEGLHDLANDTIAPSDNKNLKFDDAAREQQYFTTVGKKDFSVPLDFDNMHSAAKNGILSPGGLSEDGRAAMQKAHSSPYAPVESFADVAKFLPDADLAKISERAQKTIVKHLQQLGDPSMIEEAAKAGSIQRGWYKRTGDLIRGMFGDDSKKFTDMLAATSPNTSVEINFRNALNLFADWVGAGKPTGPEGAKALDKVLTNHNFGIANSAIKDNIRGMLVDGQEPSGPKVSNFSKNIQGEMNSVTKDRWVAYLLGKGTKYFNTGMKGEGPRAGHYATDIIIRQVAKKLDMLPAEVQESGWSFIRTALNMAEEKGITPDEAARTVTNDDIKRGSSEFTRLIANDTGIRIALDKLADRTGNDAFRPVNIEKSGLYQHLLQAANQQQPVAGGIASANPEILARTAERASAARAGAAGSSSATAGPVDDTSFNPSELDKPENPNVAAQETDAAAVDPVENARRASIRRAKQQEKLAKRGVSGGSDADVPTFYSKAAQVINQKIANIATPEQIRATLKNNGVKDSELQWMGIDSFLKDKTKVSKADLEKFAQENQIQLKDATYGSDMHAEKMKLVEARAKAYAENNKIHYEELRPLAKTHGFSLKGILEAETTTPEQIEAATKTAPPEMQDVVRRFLQSDTEVQKADRALDEIEKQQGDVRAPKYTNWQLDGPKANEREILMQIKPQHEQAAQSIDDVAQKLYGKQFYQLEPTQAQAAWRKLAAGGTDPNTLFEYKTHWEEPNVVAHTRINDRTSVDGKKTLFMEEAQSDWAQQGHGEGWENESETTPASPAGTKFEMERNPDGRGYTIHDEHGRTWWAGTHLNVAQDRLAEFNQSGVPATPAKTTVGKISNMPFKNNWHELVMKRLLRMAAEKGYDQLAWTTGAQQAERYSLAKAVSTLRYVPETKTLLAFDHAGDNVLTENVESEKLPDYIGKDAAKQLLAAAQSGPTDRPFHELQTKDLKVGGEFHKKLYDQKIPQFLEKYAKKWGAKVGTTEVSTATTPYPFVLKDIDGVSVGVYKTEKQATDALEQSGQAHRGWHIEKDDKTEKVHSIQITPEMKKSVMKEGQPIAKAEPTWADGLKDLAV